MPGKTFYKENLKAKAVPMSMRIILMLCCNDYDLQTWVQPHGHHPDVGPLLRVPQQHGGGPPAPPNSDGKCRSTIDNIRGHFEAN
jgi:hypothetical protein